ncbi:hypothetical protein RYX36_011498 [Vicia faba]
MEDNYKTLEIMEKNPKLGCVFSMKEVDLDLATDLESLQRMSSIIGFDNAMKLTLTTRRFSSLEAKELDLISRIFHSQHELDEGVRNFLRVDIG